MRRITRHVLVGFVLTGLAAGGVTVGLAGPPVGKDLAQAGPLTTPVTAVTAENPAALAAVERYQPTSRTAGRPPLPAAQVAEVAAERRETALVSQEKSIAAQRKAIQRKRAAAAAQRKRLAAKLGYQPGTTDPRSIARQILANKYGHGADQYTCFNNIIMRESAWKVTATNPSSGAYGIPQALPGSKMATVASDWRTNPATQITWAIGYMKDVYGSPCAAWSFKSANGWY